MKDSMNFTILQAIYSKDNSLCLEECFESLLKQTLPIEKIILVKDGLITAELETTIEKWKEKLPLQVEGYEQNQGLAHALNYGLQFVKTEYVARMDSDDICFSDRFEKQLDYIKSHPECVICGTGIEEFYVNANSTFRKNRMYPSVVNKSSKSLFKGTPLGHPTVMIKTDVLKEFLYNENTFMNEDIDLWFRLIKSGYTIYNLQEPLLRFRITDGTFKRRSIKKAFNEFKIYFSNSISLFGFSFYLIFPFIRLFLRFMPYSFSKKLYFSKIRNSVLEEKKR